MGDQTKLLVMETLKDIIALGNAAANAGEPLVNNWPQVRGALLMLGRAAGGPDKVQTSTFHIQFPASFDALSTDQQSLIPNRHVYRTARAQVSLLFWPSGEIEDPWEHLRTLIRRSGREEIERGLPGLSEPAKAAGMNPADIRTNWVWSLDAERGVLSDDQLQRRAERERKKQPKAKLSSSVRQRLRRGVTVFNELFDLPEVAKSGLLPPDPIGPPPDYDRQGRQIYSLPPTLARYQAAAIQGPKSGLQQVWQAICVSGSFGMPKDPVADDLLIKNTWRLITQLPESITGVSDTTWHQYVSRVRRVLLPHVTLPVPEHLPAWLKDMIDSRKERLPLQALWRLMCERDMVDATPDDLLHLATWRELWGDIPSGVKRRTWATYEGKSRKLMVSCSDAGVDPYRVVTRVWTELSKEAKAALDPIRRTAERALMRPLDLTSEWVSAQGLEPAQQAQVTDALREVFFMSALVCRPIPVSDPAEVAWSALRAAMKAQGIRTMGLADISGPAIDDGKAPNDLSLDWGIDAATKMVLHKRTKFSMQLHKLDSLLSIPDLATMLYAEPIGPLPDLARGRKNEPPVQIIRQTDAVTATHKRRPSTCREARATVRKVWKEATRVGANAEINTLGELLLAAGALDLDQRTRRKAARLQEDLLIHKEAL